MSDVADWRVIAASVAGKRHIEKGVPCQDSHLWSRPRPDSVLIAVADGAGSQPFSEHGSRLATKAVTQYLQSKIGQDNPAADCESARALLIAAFRHTFSCLETEAVDRGAPLSSLATTLIAVIVAPDIVAAMQVGDGAVVVANEDGTLFALTTPDNGEYLDLTSFVTDPTSVEEAQFQMASGQFNGVVALTDGLQMQTMKAPSSNEPRWRPHGAFFAPLLEFARTVETEDFGSSRLTGFLSTERIQERSDDDMTFVFAARVRVE
jgi:serine/threonine protein phosphatase PrpC